VYVPRGFDHRRALQLADLVGQAYAQLAAFKANRTWTVEGGYTLISELRCGVDSAESKPPRSSARASRTQFDRELRELVRSRAQRERGLPLGFIAGRGSEVFVVFRGTMTNAEWLRDLKVRLVPYPPAKPGKVHDGFAATYELVRRTVIESLEKLPGGRRLYVTGHSLGAALATLALPEISSLTPCKSPFAYTFGSPRVGDRVFAQEFNRMMGGRSFRIANTSDLVVSMPLPAPFLGFLGGYFTHVDTPVDFTVQEESNEKNHDLGTYRAALVSDRRRGLLGYPWR
jgi:triacylglycerol lipase